MSKEICWIVRSYYSPPIKCEILKNTAKQIKCVEIGKSGRGYEHTLTKGVNVFADLSVATQLVIERLNSGIKYRQEIIDECLLQQAKENLK